MRVHQDMLGDILRLRLVGRLDSNSSPELEKILLDEIAAGKGVVLDFSDLDYISSAGLRILLMGAKRAKQRGTKLALFGLRDSILEVFKVCGFLKILNVFGTMDEARGFVGG